MKNVKLSEDNNKIIESLLYGSLSSTITTVLFQPLELVKTNIQLRDNSDHRIIGRTTQSASKLIKTNGVGYLWRGTAAVSTSKNLH